MNTNQMFDKKRFAEYIKQAKGKRSINKYALDSGVDSGYISRLSRCLIERPPSAAIIKKLADKAHNNVRVEQFLSSAGYIDELQKVVNERVMKETTEKLTGRKMEYSKDESEETELEKDQKYVASLFDKITDPVEKEKAISYLKFLANSPTDGVKK